MLHLEGLAEVFVRYFLYSLVLAVRYFGKAPDDSYLVLLGRLLLLGSILGLHGCFSIGLLLLLAVLRPIMRACLEILHVVAS